MASARAYLQGAWQAGGDPPQRGPGEVEEPEGGRPGAGPGHGGQGIPAEVQVSEPVQACHQAAGQGQGLDGVGADVEDPEVPEDASPVAEHLCQGVVGQEVLTPVQVLEVGQEDRGEAVEDVGLGKEGEEWGKEERGETKGRDGGGRGVLINDGKFFCETLFQTFFSKTLHFI